MRWVVISDCHGNVDALRAVLVAAARLSAERILNLGDHASGPLAARDTLDLIASRADIISIRGNHDRYLLGDPAGMGQSDVAARAELTSAHLSWLADLPAPLLIDDVFLCHGTPRSDETYWLEHVTPEGHVLRRDRASIEAEAQGVEAQVMLCGHTHLPGIVALADGRLVVNPGSVGLPAYDDVLPAPHVMETGDAAARFALMERSRTGWDISLHRVAYDPAPMATLARTRHRPDWAHALETGWFAQSPM